MTETEEFLWALALFLGGSLIAIFAVCCWRSWSWGTMETLLEILWELLWMF